MKPEIKTKKKYNKLGMTKKIQVHIKKQRNQKKNAMFCQQVCKWVIFWQNINDKN